mgnify:CR=1 FL=1
MKSSLLKYTPGFIFIAYAALFLVIKNPALDWDRVILSDGKAYYAYLTATFIYNDLEYGFVENYEEKYYPADKSVFKEFRQEFRGEIVNIAFPGLAILWLPFFLIAHILAGWLGFEADGYSLIYQYAIGLAALFYLWLGLLLLSKLLNRFISSPIKYFIIIVLAFGTNIIHYAIVEPSMTHVYSFALITGFLYFTALALEQKKIRWFVLTSLAYGLMVITRPTNAIFIFMIPFMAGSLNAFRSALSGNHKAVFYGLATFMLVVMIPPLLWYAQTGYFFVYSYGEAGFDFTSPDFFRILFSYHKGWFVYTPVAFIAMFGFAGLYRADRTRFWILLLLLLIHIYIASCWWNWSYASKFGQRVFIDFYAIPAILLAYLWNSLRRHKSTKNTFIVILSALTLFNLVQFLQHRKWIYPGVYITKEIYWDSFFKMRPQAQVYLNDTLIAGKKAFMHNLESRKGWRNEKNIIRGDTNSYIRLDTANQYSVEFSDTIAELFTTEKTVIKAGADILPRQKGSSGALVIECITPKFTYSYNPFYLNDYIRKDRWTHVEFALDLPGTLTLDDEVKVYIYRGDSSEVLLVDNMIIEAISIREKYKIPANIARNILLYSKKKIKEFTMEGRDLPSGASSDRSFTGERSLRLDPDREFGLTWEGSLEVSYQENEAFLITSAHIFTDEPVSDSRIIYEFMTGDKQISYLAWFPGERLVPGSWTHLDNIIPVPATVKPASARIYFWNPSDHETIYIDDFRIELITLKKDIL